MRSFGADCANGLRGRLHACRHQRIRRRADEDRVWIVAELLVLTKRRSCGCGDAVLREVALIHVRSGRVGRVRRRRRRLLQVNALLIERILKRRRVRWILSEWRSTLIQLKRSVETSGLSRKLTRAGIEQHGRRRRYGGHAAVLRGLRSRILREFLIVDMRRLSGGVEGWRA